MRRISCLLGLLALAACQQSTPTTDAAPQQEVAEQTDTPNPTESPIDPDPNNPLIGDWKLDDGLACIYNRLTFTEDMRVMHRTGSAAQDIPTPVDTYKVAGGKVQVEVVGEDNPVTYVVFDASHIGDGTEACRFHKVSAVAVPPAN
ncbi:hypothetical protein EWE75_18510 [Sphingomonas populi]|uniref:Lipoprotein n=1 Tax=Sphingomonas populi TaxID=2484750 RepID=A0A4Q6XRF3_9SPHN|nr:hypothetical protein [Sphingomonas populi]RZF62983.1 hypothetical protein EWE75_18510 [Sphingomonas populi]